MPLALSSTKCLTWIKQCIVNLRVDAIKLGGSIYRDGELLPKYEEIENG